MTVVSEHRTHTLTYRAFRALCALSLLVGLLGSIAVFVLRSYAGATFLKVEQTAAGARSVRVIVYGDQGIVVRRKGPPDFWPELRFYYPNPRAYVIGALILPVVWVFVDVRRNRHSKRLGWFTTVCAASPLIGAALLPGIDPLLLFNIILAATLAALLIFIGIPAFIAALFRWGARIALARRLARQHHCAGCGYDLRATPLRCPECGRVPGG